jgi:hypothetical protein
MKKFEFHWCELDKRLTGSVESVNEFMTGECSWIWMLNFFTQNGALCLLSSQRLNAIRMT